MGEKGRRSPEIIKPPRIEERILRELGFERLIDVVIGHDSKGHRITGGRFLNMYGESPHRQQTKDMLLGFIDMKPGSPDYEDSKKFILTYMTAYFQSLGVL